jgi:hypothetical protein
MGAPGRRALLLLFIAACCAVLSPSGAAQGNVFALRVQDAEGASKLKTGGRAYVSVSSTLGVVADNTASPWARADAMPKVYVCIGITISVSQSDSNCGYVASSGVMIDPTLNSARINVTLPSFYGSGKKLRANVTILATGLAQPAFNPLDVTLQPPLPNTDSIRYVGPAVGRSKDGAVTGTIKSDALGNNGELVPYAGPVAGDSAAYIFDGMQHGLYVTA